MKKNLNYKIFHIINLLVMALNMTLLCNDENTPGNPKVFEESKKNALKAAGAFTIAAGGGLLYYNSQKKAKAELDAEKGTKIVDLKAEKGTKIVDLKADNDKKDNIHLAQQYKSINESNEKACKDVKDHFDDTVAIINNKDLEKDDLIDFITIQNFPTSEEISFKTENNITSYFKIYPQDPKDMPFYQQARMEVEEKKLYDQLNLEKKTKLKDLNEINEFLKKISIPTNLTERLPAEKVFKEMFDILTKVVKEKILTQETNNQVNHINSCIFRIKLKELPSARDALIPTYQKYNA